MLPAEYPVRELIRSFSLPGMNMLLALTEIGGIVCFFVDLFDESLGGAIVGMLDGAIDGLEVLIVVLLIFIINVPNRL